MDQPTLKITPLQIPPSTKAPHGRKQAMSHSITVEFGPYGPTADLTCDAPANAGCRARFDECGCPEWWGQGDDDGIPYHTTDDGDRHQGRYDPEWCNEVEWFDAADGLDNTRGQVTFAVEAEWDDEHYTWHVKPMRFRL